MDNVRQEQILDAILTQTGSTFDANGGLSFAVVSSSDLGRLVAAPTGVAETDRANVQAAIDAVHAAGGGIVQLRPGTYLIGTPGLVWPANCQVGITLRGTGIGGTPSASQATRLTRNGAYPIITAAGTSVLSAGINHGLGLQDITLNGGSQAAILVSLDRCAAVAWENVRLVASAHHALKAIQLWNSRFTNCLFEASGSAGSSLASVLITGNSDVLGNTNTVQFVNCQWEGNLYTDLEIAGATDPSTGVVVTGSKFERSAGHAVKFTNAQDCVVVGAYIFINGALAGVYHEGGSLNAILGCMIFQTTPTTSAFNVDCASGGTFTIVGNSLKGAGTANIRLQAGFGVANIAGNTHASADTPLADVRTTKTPLGLGERRVFSARARFDALGAGTSTINEGGANSISGSSGGLNVFYVDPADYPQGATKFRLEMEVVTNDTAPAATFTGKITPVTGSGGAAANVTVTAGTPITDTVVVTTPAANTRTRAVSAQFSLTAGPFILQVDNTAMAASSSAAIRLTLQAVY